jgi:hypothetical protein
MRTEMNKPIELAFAHSILLAGACIGIGIFLIAGWMPLIEPSMGPEALSELFERDRLRILVGITVYGVGGMFWWTFACTVATQMKRIEGEHYPLTRLQVVSSSGTALTIMFGTYLVLAMVYRPGIEPTALQMMNDFWWLTFVGIYGPGVVQNMAIGLCIVTDKNDTKIYPRWVGFVNFWVAFLFVPGIYIAFFKDGPFAWDGILGFWVIAVGFFGWVVVMWWATVRAIKNA